MLMDSVGSEITQSAAEMPCLDSTMSGTYIGKAWVAGVDVKGWWHNPLEASSLSGWAPALGRPEDQARGQAS